MLAAPSPSDTWICSPASMYIHLEPIQSVPSRPGCVQSRLLFWVVEWTKHLCVSLLSSWITCIFLAIVPFESSWWWLVAPFPSTFQLWPNSSRPRFDSSPRSLRISTTSIILYTFHFRCHVVGQVVEEGGGVFMHLILAYSVFLL